MEALTQVLHDRMPFTAAIGLELVQADPACVVVRGDWDPDHCTDGGVLHGGYLMALADAAGAACAQLNLPAGAFTSTIESKTNFLRAVRTGAVIANATPLHIGTRTIVVQIDVTRNDGRLVTRSTSTQAVLAPEPTSSRPTEGVLS
jgi:uncharacterized protein (TIGR00369 family)